VTAILRKSTRNLQACTEVGLIEKILLRLSAADEMLAGQLTQRLSCLICFTLPGMENITIFSKMWTISDIFDMFDIFDIYQIFSIFSFYSIGLGDSIERLVFKLCISEWGY